MGLEIRPGLIEGLGDAGFEALRVQVVELEEACEQVVLEAGNEDLLAGIAGLAEQGEDPAEPCAVEVEQRAGELPGGVADLGGRGTLDLLDECFHPLHAILEVSGIGFGAHWLLPVVCPAGAGAVSLSHSAAVCHFACTPCPSGQAVAPGVGGYGW